MNRLDSEGLSVSFSSCSLSQLDDSYCSSDDYLEETGATLDLELPDGTKEVEVSRLLLSVGPVEGLKDHFTVRLATNHYSFTLGRSVAIRSYNSFLYIQVTLTTMWSSRTELIKFISEIPGRTQSLRPEAVITKQVNLLSPIRPATV